MNLAKNCNSVLDCLSCYFQTCNLPAVQQTECRTDIGSTPGGSEIAEQKYLVWESTRRDALAACSPPKLKLRVHVPKRETPKTKTMKERVCS